MKQEEIYAAPFHHIARQLVGIYILSKDWAVFGIYLYEMLAQEQYRDTWQLWEKYVLNISNATISYFVNCLSIARDYDC